MTGIASAATSVVIGHLAGGTSDDPRRRRRHHAAQPRAARHRRAVRDARGAVPRAHRPRPRPRARDRPGHRARAAPRCRRASNDFPREVQELQALPRRRCAGASASRPCPAAAPRCRCGSSARARSARSSRRCSGCRTRSRRTSRPTRSTAALDAVPRARSSRRRSSQQPYVMAASTSSSRTPTREAARLFTTMQQGVRRTCTAARPGATQPPIDDIDEYWTPQEKLVGRPHAARTRSSASPETVRDGLDAFVERHAAPTS